MIVEEIKDISNKFKGCTKVYHILENDEYFILSTFPEDLILNIGMIQLTDIEKNDSDISWNINWNNNIRTFPYRHHSDVLREMGLTFHKTNTRKIFT